MPSSQILYITEVFSSIQGETSFAGLPTFFIRLARCNLRCSWCDTTYSFNRGIAQTISGLVEQVNQSGCRYVCITGGEPLMQSPVHSLMSDLCDQNYLLSLETGGSLSITQVDSRVSVILDVKCPGSGMDHKNYWSNLEVLKPYDQVKFVLKNHDDYLYAKGICFKYHLFEKVKEVLFSPVHGGLDAKELVSWILADRLPVRLNLQLHKFIWSPFTKGV